MGISIDLVVSPLKALLKTMGPTKMDPLTVIGIHEIRALRRRQLANGRSKPIEIQD